MEDTRHKKVRGDKMPYIEEFTIDELEEIFAEKEKHEQFKEKLAKKLADTDAPCHDFHWIDEVANFCDEEEMNYRCNPTECWLRCFEQIEKEG